jgi:hypothetical protein
MGRKKGNRNRDQGGSYFAVLDLNGMGLADDLSENLVFSCTNKTILSRNTGIPYHRLVTWFTKMDKSVLIEGGNLILRSKNHYKGKQPGGLRNLQLVRRDNF